MGRRSIYENLLSGGLALSNGTPVHHLLIGLPVAMPICVLSSDFVTPAPCVPDA